MQQQHTHESSESSEPGIVPFTSNVSAMTAVTTVFFMWGLITSLNDIIIPHLKAIFELNYTKSMLIQFCFFSAYFVFAAPFGKVVEKIGYQKTIVVGLLTAGVGALLFIPAALTATYVFFLGALIVLAAGITGLQVAANPYVSVLGHPNSASSRLNLAQALNSLGTTLGPFVGGILILSAALLTPSQMKALSAPALQAYRAHEASSVIMPYIVLAAVLAGLAVMIGKIKLPTISESQPDVHSSGEKNGKSIWQSRHTVLGALGIFLYVGAEVSIGSFLVSYFTQHEIGGFTQLYASKIVSIYWGCAMVGRFIGSAVLRKIGSGIALGAVAIVAACLVTSSMLTFGLVAVTTIVLVGLFNSIMFPNIFTLGIAKLGPLTGEGSGLLIAAIVGGAIIPVLQGRIADTIGIHHAFILPVLCYIYLAYYGFIGSKPAPELDEQAAA
jgi:FHS family L-fucose permease-like MFS transporter